MSLLVSQRINIIAKCYFFFCLFPSTGTSCSSRKGKLAFTTSSDNEIQLPMSKHQKTVCLRSFRCPFDFCFNISISVHTYIFSLLTLSEFLEILLLPSFSYIYIYVYFEYFLVTVLRKPCFSTDATFITFFRSCSIIPEFKKIYFIRLNLNIPTNSFLQSFSFVVCYIFFISTVIFLSSIVRHFLASIFPSRFSTEQYVCMYVCVSVCVCVFLK